MRIVLEDIEYKVRDDTNDVYTFVTHVTEPDSNSLCYETGVRLNMSNKSIECAVYNFGMPVNSTVNLMLMSMFKEKGYDYMKNLLDSCKGIKKYAL